MSFMMQAHELEKLLITEIPISSHMAVHSLRVNANELSLILPLTPNINHKGTLFGGSLYSASALACYGLFLFNLQCEGLQTKNIVISDGNIRYLAPVAEDAVVRSRWNSFESREQFFKTLRSRLKARGEMLAQISVRDQICAEFSGHFVAHL